MFNSHFFAASFVAVFLGAISLPSQAATVNMCGTTICYEYEDTQAALGVYGAPILIGDMMVFVPPNFRAESLDGAGLVTTSASFVFDRVYSISGANIMAIRVDESGDYEIHIGDDVSDTLDILIENNNSAESGSDTNVFSASGDSAGQQEWDIDVSYDPSVMFTATAKDVKLTITNTLEAETDASGETAWIQKKLEVTSVAAPLPDIPIPAAAWLFGSGLLTLLGWRRRQGSVSG